MCAESYTCAQFAAVLSRDAQSVHVPLVVRYLAVESRMMCDANSENIVHLVNCESNEDILKN